MPRAKSYTPKKRAERSEKIDPNKLKTRDELILKIIGGATKSGIQPDRKKEENRTRSRKRVKTEDEY